MEPKDEGAYGKGITEETNMERVERTVGNAEHVQEKMHGADVDEGSFKGTTQETKDKEDPWKKQRGGPSEGWQPQAWTPGSTDRRL